MKICDEKKVKKCLIRVPFLHENGLIRALAISVVIKKVLLVSSSVSERVLVLNKFNWICIK